MKKTETKEMLITQEERLKNNFKASQFFKVLVNLREARNALSDLVFIEDDLGDEFDEVKDYLNNLNHIIDMLDIEYRLAKNKK